MNTPLQGRVLTEKGDILRWVKLRGLSKFGTPLPKESSYTTLSEQIARHLNVCILCLLCSIRRKQGCNHGICTLTLLAATEGRLFYLVTTGLSGHALSISGR